MEDEKKTVLIVDTEPESRRTLSGIVAGLMAREGIVAANQPPLPVDAPPKTLEERVRERVAHLEGDGRHPDRARELRRLKHWLGQGPRKVARLEVVPGEELKLGGYVLTVRKIKRDGRLRVSWNGGRPNAGHVVSIKGHPYHVTWATALEVGLAPGSPPKRDPPNFGLPDEGIPGVLLPKGDPRAEGWARESVHCKTPEDVRREFGPPGWKPAPKLSLKKQWAQRERRRIEQVSMDIERRAIRQRAAEHAEGL